MAYKIVTKKRFRDKLVSVLTYLENEWGKTTAIKFLEKVDLRIDSLTSHPYIGTPSTKFKGARGLHITKHNRLYYKIDGNTIFLINIYDTRQKSQ